MSAPTQLFNTAHDLRTFYENSILGGTYPDPNETYVLFNQVKDMVEDMYQLQIALSVDQSQTANVGDTYLTMKTLPLDYRSTVKMVLTNLGSNIRQIPYYQIPFRQREQYKSILGKYYIDQKNKKFALTGSVNAQMVINHYYKAYTGQMSVGTEDTANPIAWPARFWNIIAYGAAAIRQGNFDADAMQFRMSIEQQSTFDLLMTAFIAWDQDLKLADMNYRGGYADDVADYDTDGSSYNWVGFL